MNEGTAQICESGDASLNTNCCDINRNGTEGRCSHPLIIKTPIAATSGEVTPAFAHQKMPSWVEGALPEGFTNGDATLLAKTTKMDTPPNSFACVMVPAQWPDKKLQR